MSKDQLLREHLRKHHVASLQDIDASPSSRVPGTVKTSVSDILSFQDSPRVRRRRAALAGDDPSFRPVKKEATGGERPLRCRTVFISDTHLGFDGARAESLVAVLRRLECERVYLVGDIIDTWQIRRRWVWTEACDEAVRLLFRMAQTGVEVIYVPGNHDEAARDYVGLDIGGIEIRELDVFETADGRRLLVTHGDQYDLVVKHSRLLCMLGNAAYPWLIKLNRLYNRARGLVGKPYWSLSHYIKQRVKSACTFISHFEETLVHEAERRGLDGVVCGHIHKPEMCRLGEGLGVEYFNCGDWVESCTLLVERFDGSLEILDGARAEHGELKVWRSAEAERRSA